MRKKLITISMLALVACVSLAAEPTTNPSTQPASKTRSADETLSRMLRPRGDAAKPIQPGGSGRDVDATSGSGAVAPGAPQINVMREGTFLIHRTGRLTRGGDGALGEFTFEADGKALQDPPVIILPNLKLMAMEEAVAISSRDLRFRITGAITEYRGRNYVLLEKVVVIPDIEQQ